MDGCAYYIMASGDLVVSDLDAASFHGILLHYLWVSQKNGDIYASVALHTKWGTRPTNMWMSSRIPFCLPPKWEPLVVSIFSHCRSNNNMERNAKWRYRSRGPYLWRSCRSDTVSQSYDSFPVMWHPLVYRRIILLVYVNPPTWIAGS